MALFRFFAAARTAMGVREASSSASTLGSALEEIALSHPPADPDRWATVSARCSYLVDGVTTSDRSTPLDDVALVDVMPPFAGG